MAVSPQPTPPQYATREGDAITDREAVLAAWHGNLGRDARMAASTTGSITAHPQGHRCCNC